MPEAHRQTSFRVHLPCLRHLVGLGLLLSSLSACQQTPPPPLEVKPEVYSQVVGSFYSGVDALLSGDSDGAMTRFQKATELVPDEPAGRANLALAQVRRNDIPSAEAALAKASSLAPTNGDIAFLAALMKSRQGDSPGAIEALKKTIELDGKNLRARYLLSQELGRQAAADADAESRKQIDAILAVAPNNLVALVELARLAAKSGDKAALTGALDKIAARSSAWDDDTKQRLADAQKAASAGDTGSLGQRLAVLGNVLRGTASYRDDAAALESPQDEIGQPIANFIRLPAPKVAVAEPDTGLKFAAKDVTGSGTAARALALSADGPPTLAVADVQTLRIDGATPDSLPAAGGGLDPDSLAVIDWNNDGLPDLAVGGPQGLKLYQQGPARHWEDVTAKSGLPADTLGHAYTGVWPVDVDLEGDLDLVLGTAGGPPTVLQNNNDGTWTATSPLTGGNDLEQLAWADFDGDGDPDIAGLVSDGQGGQVTVWENDRSGHYTAVPLPAEGVPGAGGAKLPLAAAVSATDIDGDGRMDLVTMSPRGFFKRWSPSADGGSWSASDVPLNISVPDLSMVRLTWADLDNNGALDAVASGVTGSSVTLSGGTPAAGTPITINGQVTDVADVDGDGRLDLVGATADGHPVQWMNQGGTKNYHYAVIRPRSTPANGDQRINSFGVGGEMTLRSGLLSQTQPIAGPAVHFGLGDAAAADVVGIRWPNGVFQTEFGVNAGTPVVAVQRLKGSCPWLFADDGTGMKFVTDVLWRSPLGLRINAQVTAGVAQTEDWVKVRGDQLAPKDGMLDLAVTAELWETHFFDEVALMTVDHPPDTEIFLDEHFIIPPSPLAVRATGPVMPLSHVVDEAGRDVTDRVAKRDDQTLDTFALGAYQGIAQDHYAELDLAPAIAKLTSDAKAAGRANPQFVLVADGWIYPTDSSINVAISQGKHVPPRGLGIDVPDGKGGWVSARSGLGFPAGKRKTVLLDLAGLDPAGAAVPDKLRLTSNLEIYWDSFGVAELRPDVNLDTKKYQATTADLRYRGFSATNWSDPSHKAPRSVPEVPDYSHVAAFGPQWLDLIGYYTRFGDVKPLLTGVDDRYVIMNAGDELALRFAAPPAPRNGLVRDYVFISDGWEKDGDFNTSYSKTVQPLPSHDHPEYAGPVDAGPVGKLTDDPVYQAHAQDWVDYQTRYVGPRPVARAAVQETQK